MTFQPFMMKRQKTYIMVIENTESWSDIEVDTFIYLFAVGSCTQYWCCAIRHHLRYDVRGIYVALYSPSCIRYDVHGNALL
jgi:hypothetical protein